MDGSGVVVTVSGDATATVDTDSSGDITAVTILTAGSGYSAGDVVTITEDGGDGEATAKVATIV